MRIGISLLCSKKKRTGTDNVAYNLIRNLPEVDERNQYVIFTTKESHDWFSSFPDQFDTVNVKLTYPRGIWLWEHLFFHLDARRNGVDLIYFPQARGVLGYRGRNVLMIHDLNAYMGLYNVQFRQYLLYRTWYKVNVPNASMIVTVSEHIKNQIMRRFSVPSHKVRVVHNGVDDRFKPGSKSEVFKKKYGLPARYILFVGSSYGNKNLKRLIEAHSSVCRKKVFDHHLVIAGGPGDQEDIIQDLVKKNHLQDIVHLFGYFPDNELPCLYNNAELFVFPALAEGFGIPPLEAMACGTPVLASDTPVSREVLGDSAIMVNPYSIDSIAEGITKVLGAASLRNELKRKGVERVKKYSWKKTASEMVKVFEEAGNSC